jgi:hypothetical protein
MRLSPAECIYARRLLASTPRTIRLALDGHPHAVAIARSAINLRPLSVELARPVYDLSEYVIDGCRNDAALNAKRTAGR